MLRDLIVELNDIIDADNPLKYKTQLKLYNALRKRLTVYSPDKVCSDIEKIIDELVDKEIVVKPKLINTIRILFLNAVRDHYESVASYVFDKYLRKSTKLSQKILTQSEKLKKLSKEVILDAVEDNYEDVRKD